MSRRALADDRGFTLPELLIGMTLAMVVLFAAFQTLDTVIGTTGKVQRRVEAGQRGRAAMDDVVRQLRSQVCLSAAWAPNTVAQPPIVVQATGPSTTAPAANGTQSVAFYVDLQKTAVLKSSSPAPPELHVITFDAVASKLVLDVYKPSVNATTKKATYPAKTTRTLLTNVHRSATTPVFRFYAFDASATPPQATLAVSPWTDATTVPGTVAKVSVTFDAWATDGKSAAAGSAVLTDDALVREVDPNAATPAPDCK
jgi:prepilin-type N-terminal cleavage/methylation domain-containing protein